MAYGLRKCVFEREFLCLERFHGRFLHFDIGVKEKPQNVHLKLIFCHVLSWFNLHERIQDPVSVIHIRELLFRINWWVFEYTFFKKLSYLTALLIHNINSKHDREITERQIFRKTLDGLLSILELKLKCCFCTCSIELLFMFLFITCHWIFLQCAALFPYLVPWIQLKPLMNEVCFQLFVYDFIFSLKQWAYLKYIRVIHFSNGRLVGFSSPSLSIFL